MKRNSSIFTGWWSVILAIAVISAALPGSAYCRTDDPVLLLQQTPAQGGTVTPDVGVHHFDLNTEVTLTAVPKPGYQFVYWLGDVSDPTASSSVVYLDTPKIIIAVFERVKYEFLVTEERPQSSPGGGGLRRSAADYSRQGGGGGGSGKRPQKWRRPSPPAPEEEQQDFPVPAEGEANDFPVPQIPEPATGILLALGSLLAFAKRRPKSVTCTKAADETLM